MHILYITSWYPLNDKDINGSFFREQAHALSNMGHKVGVIAPQFRSLRLGKRAIIARYDIEVWQDGDVPTYMKHGVFWFPAVFGFASLDSSRQRITGTLYQATWKTRFDSCAKYDHGGPCGFKST
jgi:hypothetical protein